MKIAIIGGGNMGWAMLAAVLHKGLCAPEDIAISDVNEARLKQLERDFGVHATTSNLEAIAGCEVVILAIKPQNLAEVMAEVGGKLKPEQLVLSVIAGKKMDTLRQGLKHDAIVRAMPNIPAQVGRGVTVWTATPEVTEEQKALASAILGAMGSEIYIDEEGCLDMATAVSGSGPAYLFLFMESLTGAAVEIGLPPDVARQLVLETVIGSGEFAHKSGKELSEFRKMVTSPGGTTAAALAVFKEGRFAELVRRAVVAAYDRARELGG